MYTVKVIRLNGGVNGSTSEKIVCRVNSVNDTTINELSDALRVTQNIELGKVHDCLNGNYDVRTNKKEVIVCIEYVPTISEMLSTFEEDVELYGDEVKW